MAFGATAVFRDGVDGYVGASEAHVRAGAHANRGWGGSGDIQTGFPGGSERQGLWVWDDLFGGGPGQIPLDQTIVSATLSAFLRTTGVSGESDFTAYPILGDIFLSDASDPGGPEPNPGVGQATWTYRRYDDIPWGGGTNDGPVADVDYDTSISATTTIDLSAEAQKVWNHLDVTPIVQAWLANANDDGAGVPNEGFITILTAGGGNAYWFGSDTTDAYVAAQGLAGTGADYYPYLTVEYIPEPATLGLLAAGGLLALLKRRK
jgi:hypothetical protein